MVPAQAVKARDMPAEMVNIMFLVFIYSPDAAIAPNVRL